MRLQCDQWRAGQVVLYGLLLAFAIEALTLACRFGLRLEAARVLSPLGSFTGGFRIHHGYLGLLAGAAAWGCRRSPAGCRLLAVIAIGLAASDLVHHFLVLWPLTGSPQFDFFFPEH